MVELERHQIDRLKKYLKNDPLRFTRLMEDYEHKLIEREYLKDGTKTIGGVWLTGRLESLLLNTYYKAMDELINEYSYGEGRKDN